ncbi:hypothetical protein BDW22DRAFT_222007 [Trametopsis cervina]|nr:hypothetical protein BDW22DRAFT_222007 [Trametopsis cervina]
MPERYRSASYPVPRIPPELTDRIIDYLRHDVCALSNCSLTCKSWLPRSRHHRFKKVAVDVISWQSLLRLLVRTPEIGTLVRSLCICHQTKNRIGLSRIPTWNSELLAALTDRLVNVERLQLDTIDVNPPTTEVLKAAFPRIQTLYLARVHIENVMTLFALFEFFTRLREVRFVDVFLKHIHTRQRVIASPNRSSTATGFPTLTTLRFQSRVFGDIIALSVINRLVTCDLHRNIHTLEMPDVQRPDIPHLMVLLRSLGPALQHLYIGFADPDRTANPDASGSLTLTHCTALRTLGIRSINIVPDDAQGQSRHPSNILSWVPELLTSCSSPLLEHVHLRIRAGGACFEHLTYFDWARVADVLCSGRFIGLRRLTFEIIRGDNVKDTIVPFIRAKLAEMHRRRRVVMRFLQRT